MTQTLNLLLVSLTIASVCGLVAIGWVLWRQLRAVGQDDKPRGEVIPFPQRRRAS